MKKLLVSLITAGMLFTNSFAQGCLPYGIWFDSQISIDNFQTNYPNCTEIEGYVSIHGDDIINLNGLNMLTSIGGLGIHNNDILESLEGLESLVTIGGWLEIGDNPSLHNLEGLESLVTIDGGLEIRDNPSLYSLSGLQGLVSIGLDPLGGGGLDIRRNGALVSLNGLENLTQIGGMSLWAMSEMGLFIVDNDVLQDISSLINLTTIHAIEMGSNSTIRIEKNSSLMTLSGIDNIDPESIEVFEIFENPELHTCEVQSVCNFMTNYGYLLVSSNAQGCNTQQEVQDSCVANAVNIGEFDFSKSVIIYPNPSSTQIIIELPTTPSKNTIMTICNLNGQQLITQPITEPQTVVDISGLPSGVYFVKVMDDEKVMMGKVVKE